MMGDGRWHMMGQSGSAGLWVLVIVLTLLLLENTAALVWARWPGRPRGIQPPPAPGPGSREQVQSAERILDDRLARGEIDEDTYLRTRALLDEG